MKLLIVDDNAAVRRLIKSIAQPFAREILECATGMDAVSIYRAEQPDLVLMDLRMSGVDGIAATKQIRASYPAAQVVIVTDYEDDELRQAARKAGACSYVLKENLLALIQLLETLGERSPGSAN